MIYFEELYWALIPYDPNLWPEELRDNPVKGHGLYSFSEGLRIGLALGAETYRT